MKLSAKVAEGGHKLFGSVTTIDLAAAFDKAGQSIEKKFISITGGSVKALGKYTASVRLHRDVVVDVTFEVVAE
jgi:large subunit ribosomal protein L9